MVGRSTFIPHLLFLVHSSSPLTWWNNGWAPMLEAVQAKDSCRFLLWKLDTTDEKLMCALMGLNCLKAWNSQHKVNAALSRNDTRKFICTCTAPLRWKYKCKNSKINFRLFQGNSNVSSKVIYSSSVFSY